MRVRARILAAASICFCLAGVALFAADKAIQLTPDQLKWVPNPAVPDVSTATTWGDPATGPHGSFHKFKAGYTSPLHTHSANTRAVVVQGTMAVSGEDGKETKFPVGSFFSQPNTWKHTTRCLPGADCMIYAEVDGKWDLKPVETKK